MLNGTWDNLKADEKITRVKIQLGYSNPFWSYLIMNLKFREFTKDELENIPMKTIGVDNLGNVSYYPEFINECSEKELTGILAHEVGHVAFLHLDRLKDFKGDEKSAQLWNISADMIINRILQLDGFELKSGCILPESDDSCDFLGCRIENISKKPVEVIYSELVKHFPPEKTPENSGFDNHKYTDDENAEKNGVENAESNSEKWNRILTESGTHAKQRGKLSASIGRLIGDLINPKISWRDKLYKYITRDIPSDYTYSKPSKKSIASGFYLPSSKKENLDVVVGVDVSGSISQREYDAFITELIGISKSFNSIKLRLLTWDTRIQNDYEFVNGSIEKIKEIDLWGGGGTDVNCLLEKVENDYPSTKLLIVFTDGYFDKPDENNINSNLIWVLTSNGIDSYLKDTRGEVFNIDLGDENE